MAKPNDLLSRILDEEFIGTLAKSADIAGTSESIMRDLKVVPRAVMSLLISELSPMKKGEHKEIKLPFSEGTLLCVTKNSNDDYCFLTTKPGGYASSISNHRTIPAIGRILLSTFKLCDMESLSKSEFQGSEDIEHKVQKLIDERMELHSLVAKVVENKMAEREAIHMLMMAKLGESLNAPTKMAEPALPVPHLPLPEGPIDLEAKDVMKKEAPAKKGSPLKEFLDRKKKSLQKEYHVEISKSEQIDCDDCGQNIWNMGKISSCLCYGSDRDNKIWLKKTEDGIKISFSKSWDPDNIEMLLNVLRKSRN